MIWRAAGTWTRLWTQLLLPSGRFAEHQPQFSQTLVAIGGRTVWSRGVAPLVARATLGAVVAVCAHGLLP
jgi:hypothetical protein